MYLSNIFPDERNCAVSVNFIKVILNGFLQGIFSAKSEGDGNRLLKAWCLKCCFWLFASS